MGREGCRRLATSARQSCGREDPGRRQAAATKVAAGRCGDGVRSQRRSRSSPSATTAVFVADTKRGRKKRDRCRGVVESKATQRSTAAL